jgi:hypothetical protein
MVYHMIYMFVWVHKLRMYMFIINVLLYIHKLLSTLLYTLYIKHFL